MAESRGSPSSVVVLSGRHCRSNSTDGMGCCDSCVDKCEQPYGGQWSDSPIRQFSRDHHMGSCDSYDYKCEQSYSRRCSGVPIRKLSREHLSGLVDHDSAKCETLHDVRRRSTPTKPSLPKSCLKKSNSDSPSRQQDSFKRMMRQNTTINLHNTLEKEHGKWCKFKKHLRQLLCSDPPSPLSDTPAKKVTFI